MCSYDCSLHPTDINEDNDTTGIGVLIGYCATAGIAVFIIVFHYLSSYEPRLDPFREKHADPLLCVRPRPNPVDTIVLGGPRELFFKAFGITNRGRKNRTRFEKSLVKCILSMSDIQIITSITIIVSGAAQLKCGTSTYQWQVLVYLAWFSSLTHLSCLTLLRNYLHQRPAERIWRLICMFVLVVLLILAFLPTANYRWQYGYSAKSTGCPTPQDYAICYLRPVQRPGPAPNYMYASVDNGHVLSDSSMMAMSISVVLMFVGFVCRVVWWLIISFIWGVQRLFNIVRLFPDKEDKEWSFGQVMSIALLAVPLVTAFEIFYPKSKTQEVEEPQGQMCSVSVDRSEDTSELPAYSEPPFAALLRIRLSDRSRCNAGSLSVVSLSLWCLIRACTFNGLEDLGFLQISFYPWGLTPLVLAFCIFYGILFSFLVATIGSKKRRKGEGPSLLVRSLPVIKILCLTGAALVMFAFGVSGPYPGWPPLAWLTLVFVAHSRIRNAIALFAAVGQTL
ncbi:hypothetical protein N7497_001113 [Penicillium chrysogenum]|nr:hypothetical protein N7497_001113 [Penicillium chrysogenum]